MQEGDQATGWQFTGDKEGNSDPSAPAPVNHAVQDVTWTASEYIDHDKSAGWFVRYVLAVIAIIGVIFFLTRDWVTIVLLGMLAIIFGIFAARKPDVLQYKLTNQGIIIGQKFYPISVFRSFAIMEEGPFRSVILLPLKRFMPSISIHYAPDDEHAIIEAFGNLLPQETHQQDAVDKFMHRIRF
jgi:hypothetical protein